MKIAELINNLISCMEDIGECKARSSLIDVVVPDFNTKENNTINGVLFDPIQNKVVILLDKYITEEDNEY